MSENNKPKHFLVLKIVGVIFVIIGIVGAILSFTNISNFDNNLFMIGGVLCCVGFFIGITCLVVGFLPSINKLSIKMTKYVQEENKDDLTDIANNTADIASGAVTKTVSAVKKGLKDTKFCKHCGAKIDADSKFCNKCGKEQ